MTNIELLSTQYNYTIGSKGSLEQVLANVVSLGSDTANVSLSIPQDISSSYNLVLPERQGLSGELLVYGSDGKLKWTEVSTLETDTVLKQVVSVYGETLNGVLLDAGTNEEVTYLSNYSATIKPNSQNSKIYVQFKINYHASLAESNQISFYIKKQHAGSEKVFSETLLGPYNGTGGYTGQYISNIIDEPSDLSEITYTLGFTINGTVDVSDTLGILGYDTQYNNSIMLQEFEGSGTTSVSLWNKGSDNQGLYYNNGTVHIGSSTTALNSDNIDNLALKVDGSLNVTENINTKNLTVTENINVKNLSEINIVYSTGLGSDYYGSFNTNAFDSAIDLVKSGQVNKLKTLLFDASGEYIDSPLVDGSFVVLNENDIAVAIGYSETMKALKIAQENPNNKVIWVDPAYPSNMPNLITIYFNEKELGFIAGFLAAKKTTSQKIGFVVGCTNAPDLKDFSPWVNNFILGAQNVNPNIDISINYLYDGDTATPEEQEIASDIAFQNPVGAKTKAAAMYADGVDVIWHAAGGGGAGVFEAAEEAGENFYAFGVDRDEYLSAYNETYQNNIFTSIMKNTELAIPFIVNKIRTNTLTENNYVLSFSEGGVGYAVSNPEFDIEFNNNAIELTYKLLSDTIQLSN